MRCLAGALLVALAAAPAAGEELARLVAPAPGSTLVAGSPITLEWTPGPDLAAFARAEEWEVFLSLDGGRRYPFRITPHLDLDLRRVSVRLPDLPSDDARLLLRVGDERSEREQALPGRYRILPATVRSRPPRRPALAPGEPARPGAPGVIGWIDGDRDGGNGVERESLPPPTGMAPAMAGGGSLWLVVAPPSRGHEVEPAARRETAAAVRPLAGVRLDPRPPSSRPSFSSLRRRNL